jgi:hypothetical protein
MKDPIDEKTKAIMMMLISILIFILFLFVIYEFAAWQEGLI